MEHVISQDSSRTYHVDKPTDILSNEHRLIERVLSVLENLSQGPMEALEPWKKALDFIRHFADECHHFKEEKLLFPLMEEHGIPIEGGPIGMMLVEHEEGRSYASAMLMALSLVEGGNEAAKESLVSSAQAYCHLLREHIEKEDEILFRMADEVISTEQQKKLLALFAEHEAKQMRAGVHEKYLKIAAELEGAAG